MKKKLFALLIVAVLAVTVLAGCANRYEQEAPAEETPFQVGITIQSLENSYWAGVFGVVDGLMSEKGWEYTILSSRDNSATQIQHVENFITSGVDLIMVHPVDPHALEASLAKARENGILVMSWDDKMENTDLNWVLDNTELGYTIGKAAAEFINQHYSEANPAQVAVINFPQLPILLERENGILSALEEHAPGKFEVVARQPAVDAATALSHMESILQAHPNVTIVCSIGAGGDIGANEAFMTKFQGQIPENVGIFSADATQQQLEAILRNEGSRATVGFEGSSKRTAQAVVDLYERLLNGETFSERNLFRPLLTINADNAEEYLEDYR